jgi:hypothetical protein
MSHICDDLRDLVRLADEVGALIIEDDEEVEIVFHSAELRAFAKAIKEAEKCA